MASDLGFYTYLKNQSKGMNTGRNLNWSLMVNTSNMGVSRFAIHRRRGAHSAA